MAAAPPAADADDDARANARVDADAQNAGVDWVHRMHLHHLPVWVAVALPLWVVVVAAHRRWPDTMAAVNRHRNDPEALQPAQALAVVRPVHPAPVAHNDDPVAAVHHNDAVRAVALPPVRHDTLPPLLLLLPVDSDAHGLHVPHVLPHTDDADGACAAHLHHRRQVAPTDAHDMLRRRRRQQLLRLHTMVAAVHDDPVACAPYADQDRVHDTSLH